MNNEKDNGLSFTRLIAVIIGSTIGGGIFTSAADMASGGAHTGAVLIGWGIAGVGMLALMMCFFGLNKIRPDLTNGIYSYAGEGFGSFVGFNSAWGYWISALLCNVSYVTLLFGAIGFFVPAFGTGNNILSIVCGSVIIWILNFLVMRGVKEAAGIQIVVTISKLVPIAVFLVAVIFVRAFDPSIFMENFWGDGTVAVLDQVKATTGATVWSFIGVEGAVVLSGRAKRSSDVGKASITGFLGLLAIYVMVAVLSMGVMRPADMAQLGNPQMAGILSAAVGPWGAALINIGVILSIAGALLGWTIIAADCPYSASIQGVFSKIFSKSNAKEAPVNSLYITNGIVQIFLIIVYFQESTYQVFYNLSANMIMVPYLLSAAFYLKVTMNKKGFESIGGTSITKERIFALVGTVYGLWMLYSAGVTYLLISSILYTLGIIIFIKGKKEKNHPIFDKGYEKIIAIALVALAIVSIVMIANGSIGI
ncbi:amino acid permease [Aminipila butyrica]|uniref:Amino acid permease n=1 Tax=Aminipila butyrica TaxID=433296 RepID=A0A858BQ29_9FIRM|nr:basic amino acid/polyamine antiporter [Aminipila butyrica]QIB67903.1 amino acid permease [Aminipila butyrica]